MDTYDRQLVSLFFSPSQATPQQIAQRKPGRRLHLIALITSLWNLLPSIQYVVWALENVRDEDWMDVKDTFGYHLSTFTVMLEGILDAFIIAALQDHTPPTRNMSFTTTSFDDVELRRIQERMKSLKSERIPGQHVWADFWSIANFWKHYMPFLNRPSEFSVQHVRDVCIEFGDFSSGPVIIDLVIPIYNGACDIVTRMASVYHVNEVTVPPRIG